MKMIADMAKLMKEELRASDSYASLALEWRDKNKELGDMYHTLSLDEYSHVEKIHAQVVKEIKKAESTITEADKPKMEIMCAVWDYEHGNLIEEAAGTKAKIDMYNKK